MAAEGGAGGLGARKWSFRVHALTVWALGICHMGGPSATATTSS